MRGLYSLGLAFRLIGDVICCTVSPAYAGESIGYVAEHLLEVPMDARFQAFPTAYKDTQNTNITSTVLSVKGANLRSSMLGFQISRQLSTPEGKRWQLGAFMDAIDFGGSTGHDVMRPQFGNIPGFPGQFPVSITKVSGRANQYGVFLARVLPLESDRVLAIGAALQALDISEFDVQFETVAPNDKLLARVSYAGNYRSMTPYATLSSLPVNRASRWYTAWHATLALPLPRQGFKGRLTGDYFDITGDTDSEGNGKHIPDIYIGWGYHLGYRPKNLSIDLGGMLYSAVLEPVAHKEIAPPIAISLTWLLP